MSQYEVTGIEVGPIGRGRLKGGVKITLVGTNADINLDAESAEKVAYAILSALGK